MSLSRKNSSDEIVEHKNPLYMRKTSSLNVKQGNKISDMFSEEEVSNLMQSLQARTQMHDSSLMARSRSSTNANQPFPSSPTKPHSPLTRLSMKIKNRKSMEIEPGFLRISSSPQQQLQQQASQSPIVRATIQRRNSMELARNPSYRYRAGSDAPAPNFAAIEEAKNQKDRVAISTSASFCAPPTLSSELCNSSEIRAPICDSDESFCSSIVYADEKRKVVVAATIDQLIYLLAGNVAPDKDFISQFLRTHHRFVNSKEFLQKLIDRYNSTAPVNISEEEYIKKKKIVQVRIINVIKKWIELQVSDFQTSPTLVLMLQRFVSALLKTGGTEAIWASNLQIALLQSEDEQTNPSVVTSGAEEEKPPKSILPKNMIARLMQFLDVSPLEMARQMTLLDSEAICKVQFSEYDHKKWNGDNKETLAPNLLSIIERFNKTSFWLASEILKQSDLRLRVKVLSRCIKLMRYLMEMGNMQGMMAVYSAVNITPIQRLGETWKNLKTKYSVILKSVGDLMSSSQNYKIYREHVRTAERPFIPFQLIYLSDLTFLEEAPDILDNGTINFKKMGLVGTLLNDIHTFQTITHKFTPVPSIQEFIILCVSSAMDEEQLYTISKTIEPRKEV